MVWGRERERERERPSKLRCNMMTALRWKIKWLHQQSNLTVCLKYKNVSNRNMCGGDDKQSFRLSSRQQSFNVTFDHLENHQLQSKSQMDNYNESTGWKC